MPVRNFRYISDKKSKSVSDGSGVAELYDIYATRRTGNTSYPHTLYVTSSLDTVSTFVEGDLFGPTFDLSGYYVQDTFTISIYFNGTASTSDFVDYTGTSLTPTVNVATGTASMSFSNVFRLRSGFSASGAGQTFSIRLTNNSGAVVYEKLCSITEGSYTLTPNSSSYNEGQQVSFTLTYSGAPASETIYYGFSPYTYVGGTGITSADVSSTVASSFTSSATGSGSQTIFGPVMQNDFTTEGTEVMQCRVCHYTFSYLSSYYLALGNVNINDTSLNPSASVTASTTSLNEGSSVTFTVTMTNYSSGTVPYLIQLSADAESGDVSSTGGNISISSSTGTVAITATADGYTETGQTETFYLEVLHPNGSGTVIGTSPTVTINDTSTGTPEPAGTDITSSFYEFSNRHIDSNIYMGSSADYNGPYDVAEVQQGPFVGSGRIYLGHKVTSSTTFYGDAPIACVQILSSTNTLLQTWVFNTSTGGSGSGWQTYTAQSVSQTIGLPVTPSTVSGYAYTTISTSTNVSRFSWATGTGSSYCGAADGIATPTVAMTVGNGTISQSFGTYYMFRECSGSTLNTTVFCRSPLYTFSGGEKIRIAHALTGYSAVPQNPNEALWIGIA